MLCLRQHSISSWCLIQHRVTSPTDSDYVFSRLPSRLHCVEQRELRGERMHSRKRCIARRHAPIRRLLLPSGCRLLGIVLIYTKLGRSMTGSEYVSSG